MRPSIESGRNSSPNDGPEPRIKPNEKNRLSLAFLKRTSFFNAKHGDPLAEGAGGKAMRPDSPEKAPDGPRKVTIDTTIGKDPRAQLTSPVSFADDTGARSFSVDRDRLQEAELARAGTGPRSPGSSSLGSVNRFGSVKKRLSAFNLGRKTSKNSVRENWGGRVQPVMEE